MLGYRLTSRTTKLVWASPRWLVPSLQQGEHCRPLSGCYSRKAQASNKHYRWMVSGLNTRLLSLSGSKLLDQDVCGSWKPKTFSSHHCAFSIRSNPKDAESDGKSLSLRLGERHVQVPLLWLRDHCRCQSCYNSSTFQKNVDTYSLDNLALLETNVEGDALSIKWQDGHITDYSLQWLDQNFYSPGAQVERFLWDGPRMNEKPVPSTAYEHHVNSDDGLKSTLKNILEYGFCVVEGAPATEEGTLSVTDRISFPLETVYGRSSVMVSGEMEHSDTAYTSMPLGPHIDTTYCTLPAGIQVFHCFSHNGQGGETLLVDGFKAAEKLRRLHLSHFNTLVNTTIPHEYIEGSHYHLYSLGTVLSTDLMTGALTQIRFNPYDRAPLRTVPPQDIPHFYDSYAALTNIIRSKDSAFWIKLNPGMVLLVDNWRVMHGRSSFTGRRVLNGLYLPRDDWMSRARAMGLV
ncbi:trimethyllysine dioxygenase, mitochondrial-like [Littorina saxatilis]|uniref:Trimethyllysine dioxygenase, mitochondrial n=1 Tax=Littorina saxatilis TaxID=31220 RepID=A0AAN9APU2_9CAEN